MITSVSLSTSNVPGPSSPVNIDWRAGKPVLFRVTTNSSVALSDFTVQYTLNDWQLLQNSSVTGNSSIYPQAGGAATTFSSIAYWSALSSTPYTTIPTTGSAGIHFTSSTIWPDGFSYLLPVAPAGLRIFSSASSSNILTLTVIQGEGG